MTTQFILVISGLFAAGVFLCLVALAPRPKPAIVRDRLENLGGPNRPSARALEEMELAKPFSERVVKPILKRLSRMVTRLSPGTKAEAIALKLAMAGNPRQLTVETFLGLKAAAALVFAGITLLLQFVLPPLIPPPALVTTALWTAVAGVAGAFLPERWVTGHAPGPQKAIRKGLRDPDDVPSISA